MIFDEDWNWTEWLGIVVLVLGIIHAVIWLISKAIIWSFYGLFNINWYGKFWYVYVLVLILGTIFPIANHKKK